MAYEWGREEGEGEQGQATDTATCWRSIPCLVNRSPRLIKGKAVPTRVHQCERSPRARCTSTRFYT